MKTKKPYMHVPPQEDDFRSRGLKRLGLSSYGDYLRSEHWNTTRRRLARKRCEACGCGGKLVLHHMTYLNLGAEGENDLCTLCERCHRSTHAAARRSDSLYVLEAIRRRQGLPLREHKIEALQIICPVCNSYPGQACRAPSGRALGTDHKDRRRAADAKAREKGTQRRARAQKKSSRSRRLSPAKAAAIDRAREAEFPLDALRAELDGGLDRSLALDTPRGRGMP